MLRTVMSCLLLCLLTYSAQSAIVINEIFYHGPDNTLEYIELYNAGDSTVDLSRWTLKDELDSHEFIVPSGSSLSRDTYFVIAKDEDVFQEKYGFRPDASGVGFNFSNSGDSVRLFDASGGLIEAVNYSDRAPWPESADGLGTSIERRNPALPAFLAASWAASTENGTPGEENSAYTEDLAPLVYEVDHTPKVPLPSEDVTVTARVYDADGELGEVNLYWGRDGSPYRPVEMLDDGAHGDGAAGDGVYGASFRGASLGSILGFYIQAEDDEGNETLLPEQGEEQPYLTVVENALNNETVSVLRFVMLPDVYQRFLSRYQTDDYFPATFYDGDEVYYNVHVRHRGRSRIRNGRFKIRFPHSQLYRGRIRRLNFNGTDSATILREYLSFQLYQEAGLPNMETELVRLHVNGEPGAGTPYRVAIENPDSQFLRQRLYFNNDDGNLYKTTLDGTPQNKATWRYVGDDPDLYRGCYLKQTNEEEDDYSDIIRFCKVLNEAEPWEPDYLARAESVINTDSFMRWMAVSACVAHWDSPYTDHGHNYVLYNNPSSEQFFVLAWDLNGSFIYNSNHNVLNYRKHYTHIRSTKFPTINKLLNHPVIGAKYYREIDNLLSYLFSSDVMNERIDKARDALKLGNGSVSFLRTYVNQRIGDLSEWINRDQGLAFLSKPNYQANAGQAYLYRIVAVDYQTSQQPDVSLVEAPDWLTLNPETGELSGTPPAAGEFEISIRADGKKGAIEQTFTLQVVDLRPRVLMNFNDDGARAADLSVFNNEGTLRGGATRGAGRLGQSLDITGQSDYLTIPHNESLDLSGAITVEAWIRAEPASVSNPVILTKGDANTFNYKLMLGYGPFNSHPWEPCFMPRPFDIVARAYYGEKEIESNLSPRKWVHIAGTFDSNRELVCVYHNNKRTVESAGRFVMEPNGNAIQIGLNGNQTYRGYIDDIKILPFAKQAFAAGLCLSRIDVSAISPAQERVRLSLSVLREDALDTADYCLYLTQADRWLQLPPDTLRPGNSVEFWLDDLGLEEPLGQQETFALYPASQWGTPGHEWVLDQASWGAAGPGVDDPGVCAGVWIDGRSVPLLEGESNTLSLTAFADNDDMDLDWQAAPQETTGPALSAVFINGGDVTTSDRDVELNIETSAPTSSLRMRISNAPFFDGDWTAFKQTANWQLPGEDGEHTVYVQLLNSSGQRSLVRKTTIELKQTAVEEWPVHLR
ncbi:MAG: CotH kinase family protein [Candidatus Hinthialibacter antarcticus]|nr:CotH kinase family protein [Candidatus Hinthialibacter antarcticus]